MKRAIGYFFVTDDALYYISVEEVQRGTTYRARVYSVTAKRTVCDYVMRGRSAESVAKQLENLIAGGEA